MQTQEPEEENPQTDSKLLKTMPISHAKKLSSKEAKFHSIEPEEVKPTGINF